MPALVQHRDDDASLEAALVENMAREDLNPVEAARAVAALVEELGLTREEVGRRVGRSRVAISNLLRLLDLPDEALALVEDGALSEGHGRALLLATDHDDRRRLRRAAVDGAWSVRVLEQRAREANSGRAVGPSRSRPAPSRPGGGRGGDRRGPRRGARLRRPRAPARHRLQGRAGVRERRRRDRPRASRAPARRRLRRRRTTRARRCAARIGRYTASPRGRLAQSVRALL